MNPLMYVNDLSLDNKKGMYDETTVSGKMFR